MRSNTTCNFASVPVGGRRPFVHRHLRKRCINNFETLSGATHGGALIEGTARHTLPHTATMRLSVDGRMRHRWSFPPFARTRETALGPSPRDTFPRSEMEPSEEALLPGQATCRSGAAWPVSTLRTASFVLYALEKNGSKSSGKKIPDFWRYIKSLKFLHPAKNK
jgi:hypothetical protein